jgi:hypothetical protein
VDLLVITESLPPEKDLLSIVAKCHPEVSKA